MESEEDDERNAKGYEVGDMEEGKSRMLSAEDARKTGELAEGVKKIKVGYTVFPPLSTSHELVC